MHELDPVPVVELRDVPQLRAWQEFQLSTLPQMISAMHLCHALFALHESGLLDRIRAGESNRLDGLHPPIAEGILRFLTIRGVMEPYDGGLRLTRLGEMLTSDVSMARLGIYLGAYAPVTARMTDLLTGKATYGEEVLRDGGQLGRHCDTLFGVFHSQTVQCALLGQDVSCILDVGCGGGQLLVDACLQDSELTGIGLDVSPDAIQVARELALREGVSDRIEFLVADGFAPGTWPDSCRRADALCAVSALHEEFRHSEEAVVALLNAYVATLPGLKMMLVGEPELLFEDYDNHSDFYLVHVLTGQGLPRDRHAWLAVFAQTELQCHAIYTRPGAGPRLCFYDLRPRTR